MAYTSINKPSNYFNTKLYTGTGSTQSITGVGFQPDLVWTKQRNGTASHGWTDSVRDLDEYLSSEQDIAEYSLSNNGLSSFDSDGFTVVSHAMYNGSSNTYASWNWLAGGTASSNTDGSITSSVSANTTSGFSIVSYTGTGATGTVGHGLGVAPSMIIVKKRSAVEDWIAYHKSLTATNYIKLNLTDPTYANIVVWNDTEPTSSYFTIRTSAAVNTSSATYIAYCFAEKKGFSKFGSYTGNGSTNGTFVYTGFKPAWVMVKETTNINSWRILDNKRDTYNVMTKPLYANLANAEGSSGHNTDFVSNGFKIRDSDTSMNRSGGTFIYMCFAESPFTTSTGVPTTAR